MVSLVRRYYGYRATLATGFYLPVSVIFLESQGLGLAEIGLVQGAFLFAMVAAELPTGYLGDRLGRRTALALGNGIVVAVMLGFVIADSVSEFLVVYVLWAVGWTFRTGTADAWLYELLADALDITQEARPCDRFTAHPNSTGNKMISIIYS